jgi:hypothetical protein
VTARRLALGAVALALLVVAPGAALAADPVAPAPAEVAADPPAADLTPARFAPDTARLVAPGRMELGVFAPLRWGVAERLELSVHPLWMFVAPNAALRVGWGRLGGLEWASEHSLLYPTPLMRLLSREGTGGIVPSDVTYPHLLASGQHLLVTRQLPGEHLLSARLGGTLAWNLTRFDGPRFWSQVEWHYAWPRTAAWINGWNLDGGLAAQGPVWRGFGYRATLDLFLMPGMKGDRAAEWSVVATWRPRPGLELHAGATWSWARFPYGTRTSVALPLVDAVWAFDAPWGR